MEAGRNTQDTIFPSQLTWVTEMWKSAAAGEDEIVIRSRNRGAEFQARSPLLEIGPNHAHGIPVTIPSIICEK